MVLYRPGRLMSCSLAGDRGDPIPGVYLHIQASVSPRCLLWYWRSSWRSFDRCLTDTGAHHSASSAYGVSGGGAPPVLLLTVSLRPLALLCYAVLKVILQENPPIFKKSQKQQSPDRSPDSRQPYRSTSAEERYLVIGNMRVNYTYEGVYSQGTYLMIPVFLYCRAQLAHLP